MEASKSIVRNGYNLIAEVYLHWINNRPNLHEEKLSLVLGYLNKTSTVLELGCGAGIPITKRLAANVGHVVGIDLSEKQIELCKQNVPQAETFVSDMTTLKFESESFDAVVAFYSIFHLPREEHQQVYTGVHAWLKPGGVMLVTLLSEPSDGQSDLLGAPSFHSGYSPDASVKMIEQTGFEILSAELRLQGNVDDPDDCDNDRTFFWVFARKRG